MFFSDRIRALLFRCPALFRRRRDDQMLDDEIELHLTLMEQRFIQQGLAPDEARREARRAFGGVQQLRESHRENRGFAWLTEIARVSVGVVSAAMTAIGLLACVAPIRRALRISAG